MEDSDGYQQLTSNLANTYEGVFGDIFDCVLTGMIDREVIDGKTVSTVRKLYFRGNHYIDAGCRFAQDTVPEYMVFENGNNAPEFIQILKDGMKGSITKPITDKEFDKMVKEEQEVIKNKAKEVTEEIKQKEIEENTPSKEELLEQIKSKMNDSNKKIVISMVKGFGKTKIADLEATQINEIISKM